MLKKVTVLSSLLLMSFLSAESIQQEFCVHCTKEFSLKIIHHSYFVVRLYDIIQGFFDLKYQEQEQAIKNMYEFLKGGEGFQSPAIKKVFDNLKNSSFDIFFLKTEWRDICNYKNGLNHSNLELIEFGKVLLVALHYAYLFETKEVHADLEQDLLYEQVMGLESVESIIFSIERETPPSIVRKVFDVDIPFWYRALSNKEKKALEDVSIEEFAFRFYLINRLRSCFDVIFYLNKYRVPVVIANDIVFYNKEIAFYYEQIKKTKSIETFLPEMHLFLRFENIKDALYTKEFLKLLFLVCSSYAYTRMEDVKQFIVHKTSCVDFIDALDAFLVPIKNRFSLHDKTIPQSCYVADYFKVILS